MSTYITLYDFLGNPDPNAPLVAAFGLSGNLLTTSTISSTVVQPVTLEHTGATTLTFDLAAVQSVQGWSYSWADSQGTPITQIACSLREPYVTAPPNLIVSGSGLPTCTQMVDILTLRATSTITPSIQAEAHASVLVPPISCYMLCWPMWQPITSSIQKSSAAATASPIP